MRVYKNQGLVHCSETLLRYPEFTDVTCSEYFPSRRLTCTKCPARLQRCWQRLETRTRGCIVAVASRICKLAFDSARKWRGGAVESCARSSASSSNLLFFRTSSLFPPRLLLLLPSILRLTSFSSWRSQALPSRANSTKFTGESDQRENN